MPVVCDYKMKLEWRWNFAGEIFARVRLEERLGGSKESHGPAVGANYEMKKM